MVNCKLLTIAIPTYNDYETLDNQLCRLEKQLEGKPVKLKIFDNSCFSNYDYQRYNFDDLTYVRQPLNLGADWNIFSCFVNCDTKFLWILSTNDLVKLDCVSVLIDIISRNEDVSFFHFGQNADFIGTSIVELLKHIYYPDAFTISRCIYNVSQIKEVFEIYPTLINTMQAQYLVIIHYFNNSTKSFFLKNTYDPILEYRLAGWSKEKFINSTFLALKFLNFELKNNIVNSEIVKVQVRDMLLWQLLVSRSYQNLGLLKYIFLLCRIIFINKGILNRLKYTWSNKSAILNEMFFPGFHMKKWSTTYSSDIDPFSRE